MTDYFFVSQIMHRAQKLVSVTTTCLSCSPYLLYLRPCRTFSSLCKISPKLSHISISTVELKLNVRFQFKTTGGQNRYMMNQSNITCYTTKAKNVTLTVLAPVEHLTQDKMSGLLIPTALDKLSPQHSAIFLFGCQVMQLLAECPMFPPVLLLLAKSVPFSSSHPNESLLAHCSEDFYFDTSNQILYLSEAKLQHVGHFIAVILQSMAHIAAGNRKNRKS